MSQAAPDIDALKDRLKATWTAGDFGLIAKGYELKVYDPSVREAYQHQMTGSGRGNNSIPDLQDRLVDRIGELIDTSDVLLIGNRYDETVDSLSEAVTEKSCVDLARLTAGMRSNGRYEGICW